MLCDLSYKNSVGGQGAHAPAPSRDVGKTKCWSFGGEQMPGCRELMRLLAARWRDHVDVIADARVSEEGRRLATTDARFRQAARSSGWCSLDGETTREDCGCHAPPVWDDYERMGRWAGLQRCIHNYYFCQNPGRATTQFGRYKDLAPVARLLLCWCIGRCLIAYIYLNLLTLYLMWCAYHLHLTYDHSDHINKTTLQSRRIGR